MKTVVFENVKVHSESGLAIEVEINGTDVWIPKSQLAPESEVKESLDQGTLIVNAFWAKKQGLV